MSRTKRLGAVLLLCFPAFGAAPLPHPAPLVLPGGIADAEGKVGYFAGADDNIEAIDLASGKVLWQTHEAQRPLLLDGEHLLAQAGVKRNRLRILRLSCASGECDLESDSIVFPAWVVTGEAAGHSFAAQWHVGKHQLRLDWEANAWPLGNPSLTPEDAADRKHAGGVVAIDLRSGQIEVRPAEKKAVAPPPPALPEELENKALRWQRWNGQRGQVLVLDERDEQQRFVLHWWNPLDAKGRVTRELLRGQRLTARVSLDERVLFLRDVGPKLDDGSSLMPSRKPQWWSLFSTEDGKQLGRIHDEAGMHAFVVVGQHIFYLVPGVMRGALDRPSIQPLILKAFDLTSGQKLWERPIAGKLLTPPAL